MKKIISNANVNHQYELTIAQYGESIIFYKIQSESRNVIVCY